MRIFLVLSLLLAIGLIAVPGCSEPAPSNRFPASNTSAMYADPSRKDESIVITLQHVLIGFKGNMRAKPGVVRSQEEARELATDILARARAGEDFASLVKEYSNDPGGFGDGMYRLVNFGGHGIENPAIPERNVYPRKKMAKAFGDVGFSLKVDEFGMTEYSLQDSPFGFHVIKRIK